MVTIFRVGLLKMQSQWNSDRELYDEDFGVVSANPHPLGGLGARFLGISGGVGPFRLSL